METKMAPLKRGDEVRIRNGMRTGAEGTVFALRDNDVYMISFYFMKSPQPYKRQELVKI